MSIGKSMIEEKPEQKAPEGLPQYAHQQTPTYALKQSSLLMPPQET